MCGLQPLISTARYKHVRKYNIYNIPATPAAAPPETKSLLSLKYIYKNVYFKKWKFEYQKQTTIQHIKSEFWKQPILFYPNHEVLCYMSNNQARNDSPNSQWIPIIIICSTNMFLHDQNNKEKDV